MASVCETSEPGRVSFCAGICWPSQSKPRLLSVSELSLSVGVGQVSGKEKKKGKGKRKREEEKGREKKKGGQEKGVYLRRNKLNFTPVLKEEDSWPTSNRWRNKKYLKTIHVFFFFVLVFNRTNID